MGSIFRTADAAGIEKIYLCGIAPKPIDEFDRPREQLKKVSLGAEKYVPWEHCKSTSCLIDKLKRDGYKIFAVEQDKKSIPYYKIPKSYALPTGGQVLNSKFCLVLGNEVKGLPKSILNRSDKILEIPMRGRKESLNVGVAFGIVAFHFNLANSH